MSYILIIVLLLPTVYTRGQFSQCVKDMSAYTKLTDHVFHQILHSDAADLKQVSIFIAYNIKYIICYVGSGATKKHREKKNIQVYWTGKSKG